MYRQVGDAVDLTIIAPGLSRAGALRTRSKFPLASLSGAGSLDALLGASPEVDESPCDWLISSTADPDRSISVSITPNTYHHNPSQTFPIPVPSLLHQVRRQSSQVPFFLHFSPATPLVAQRRPRPYPARVCMLAAAQLPAQGPKDAFAARGRSRQVAGTALARQASEERSRVYDRMGLSAATAGSSTRASYELSSQTLSTNAIASSSKLGEPSSKRISSVRAERKGTRSKTGSKGRKNSHGGGASGQIFVSSSSTSLSSLDDDTHRSPRIAAPVPVKAHNPPVSFLSNSYQISPPRSLSSSMSPESYDNLPSPRSLEDQVHYAYAADDIHLAKILLLRLKGIEVTSDDDPRIAAVQDEDFDFCFVPNGRVFVNEAQERQLEEIRRKEMQQLEDRKRNERLRQCEIKWFEEKQRLRQERIIVMQRKELKRLQEEERMRRAEEAERLRKEREEEELEKKRRLDAEGARRRALKSGRRPRTPRHTLGHTPSSERRPASHEEATFVYDFPTITPIAPRSSRLTPSASSSSLPSLASTQQIRNSLDTYNAYSRNPYNPRISKQQQQQQLAGITFDDSAAVSFGDVLQSMQGPLFPVTLEDSQHMPSTSSCSASPLSPPRLPCTSLSCPNIDISARKHLLDILLEEVSHDSAGRRTRSTKGKEPEVKQRRRRSCFFCSAPGSPLGHGGSVKMSASLSSIASTSSTSSSTSSSSISSSSSSASIRRTSSWLSFRGVSTSSLYTSGNWKSASSSTTDLTVPSPSPSPKPTPHQWFAGVSGRAKSTTSVPTISSDIITTFIKPTVPRTPPSSTPLRVPLRHPSCLACGLHVEPISIADGPLGEAEVEVSAPAVRQTPYAHQGTLSRSSSLRSLRRADQEEKQNILSRVARFVEMARNFQSAYVGLATGSTPDASREQQGKVNPISSKDMAICVGTRARRVDVLAFTAPLDPIAEAEATAALAASQIDGVALITGIKPCPDSDSDDEEEWLTPATIPRAPEYIPLPPMPRASADPDAPFPMTALPNPLPYKTHFKPVLSPSRSPFRFHALSELHTVYPSYKTSSPAHSLSLKGAGGEPPRVVTWRIRSVANPMFLRMRACQNILRIDGQGADQEMEKLMVRQRQRAQLTQVAHQAAQQGVNPSALLLATVGSGRERVTGIAYEGLEETTLKNVVAVSTISRRGTPTICS